MATKAPSLTDKLKLVFCKLCGQGSHRLDWQSFKEKGEAVCDTHTPEEVTAWQAEQDQLKAEAEAKAKAASEADAKQATTQPLPTEGVDPVKTPPTTGTDKPPAPPTTPPTTPVTK